jgi:hypothetical protein
LVLTTALFAACGEGVITDLPTQLQPQLDVNPTDGVVFLQKRGPEGTTATFSITATGGNFPLGSTVTLDACPETPCSSVMVWYGAELHDVTITETDFTGDLILERIRVISDLDGTYNIFWPEDPTVTVRAGAGYDAGVTFKNVGTPPNGEAGCTPGFWKQPHHFEYWTEPYTPATLFGDVFLDALPGKTLLDALEEGGGQLDALGRHSVAALLNAASPDVDYGMTPDQVISAFNAAYLSGDYETQKDAFEALNERGCTAKKKNK